MNESDAACQVIEHQQGTRRDIVCQGHPALRAVARRQVLKEAHDIVSRVPDEPTSERHTRDVGLRLRRARQRLTQSGEELRARGGQRPPLRADRQPSAIEPHLEAVTEADERVTRQPLAAFDALQQETRLERGELHECRHRCVEIARYVEWRFQCAPTIKNPSPEVSGDGFWCRESLLSVARKKLTASPLRLRSAPPTNALAVRALLRHLWAVSPPQRSAVKKMLGGSAHCIASPEDGHF